MLKKKKKKNHSAGWYIYCILSNDVRFIIIKSYHKPILNHFKLVCLYSAPRPKMPFYQPQVWLYCIVRLGPSRCMKCCLCSTVVKTGASHSLGLNKAKWHQCKGKIPGHKADGTSWCLTTEVMMAFTHRAAFSRTRVLGGARGYRLNITA